MRLISFIFCLICASHCYADDTTLLCDMIDGRPSDQVFIRFNDAAQHIEMKRPELLYDQKEVLSWSDRFIVFSKISLNTNGAVVEPLVNFITSFYALDRVDGKLAKIMIWEETLHKRVAPEVQHYQCEKYPRTKF